MKIESPNAQIEVHDSGIFAGVNIRPAIYGYAADLQFWGGKTYVAKKDGCPFIHILQTPGERWLQDLKDDGWIIIGELSELINK